MKNDTKLMLAILGIFAIVVAASVLSVFLIHE